MGQETNEITIFSQGARMLAEADSIAKAKELKNIALTASEWARRKNMGEEAIRYAQSWALRAERKMGEMLRYKPPAVRGKAGPGRGKKACPSKEQGFSNEVPTLSELGVSRKEAMRAQAIADVPEETFEKLVTGEAPVTKVLAEVKRQKTREKRKAQTIEIAKGNADLSRDLGKFPVIYADPPWRYEHIETENRAIENQYPTMTLDEICALPVADLATPDCVLFLWATSPKLAESMRVIEAWGFDYRTCMVWVKDKIGMGYYARQRHELLLIAKRGTPITPEASNRPDSVVNAKRGKHSEKPDEFYQIIESMYPEFPKIELFARKARKGWKVWGNQSKVA